MLAATQSETAKSRLWDSRPGNLGVSLQGTSRLKIGFAPVEQIERLEIRIE